MPRLPEGLRPGGRFAEWMEVRPRAAFFDVDGTTLELSPRATPTLVAAFASVADTGLAINFATGRPHRGVAVLREQLGIEGIDVVHNGAQVISAGAAAATWALPRSGAARLAAWCGRHEVYAEFYLGDEFYVTDLREAARPSWEAVSGEPSGLVGALDMATTDVIKVTVNAFPPALESDIVEASHSFGLMAEISTSPLFPGVAVVNATRAGVDKGTGVVWAAGRLDAPPDALLVVGDGDNDLPMFRIAGTAVAMGQAPDHVAAAAHLVTDTIDRDGLAHVLRADLGG